MRNIFARWWPALPPPAPSGLLVRPDHRPRLAQVMCCWCAHRWLAGRSLWHGSCAEDLGYAFDLHFERLHGGDA